MTECEDITCKSGKPAAWLARIRQGASIDHIDLCDDCMANAQEDEHVDLVGFRLLNEGAESGC